MTKHHFGRIAGAMTILAIVMPVAGYGSSDEKGSAAASSALASSSSGQEKNDDGPVATEPALVSTQMEWRHFAAYLNTHALFFSMPKKAASGAQGTMDNTGAGTARSCAIEPGPQPLIRDARRHPAGH